MQLYTEMDNSVSELTANVLGGGQGTKVAAGVPITQGLNKNKIVRTVVSQAKYTGC